MPPGNECFRCGQEVLQAFELEVPPACLMPGCAVHAPTPDVHSGNCDTALNQSLPAVQWSTRGHSLHAVLLAYS
jgi:hypothetical protein